MKNASRLAAIAGILATIFAFTWYSEAKAEEAASEPSWDREVNVRNAAFRIPRGAPAAILHGPAGYTAGKKLDLVIFLHGWKGCARVIAKHGNVACKRGAKKQEGWALAHHHDRAGTNTIFVTMQLAYLKSKTDAGEFADPKFTQTFFEQVLDGPVSEQLHMHRSWRSVRSITLVAHSAGYKTAEALLKAPSFAKRVKHVALFDALYGGVDTFAAWMKTADADARLVSVVTKASAKTKQQSRKLARKLKKKVSFINANKQGEVSQSIDMESLTLLRSSHGHGMVPQKHLTQILSALPLEKR